MVKSNSVYNDKPNSKQSDLSSKTSTSKTTSDNVTSSRQSSSISQNQKIKRFGRGPIVLTLEEKYERKIERKHAKLVVNQLDKFKVLTKYLKELQTKSHKRVIRDIGPKWYQEPSNQQTKYAEELRKSIPHDIKHKTIDETLDLLISMGINPPPSRKLIKKAIVQSNNDAVEFLYALIQIINPNMKEFTINDRIIISCLVHLALPETLRELHIRIPSPERRRTIQEEKKVKIPYKKYESTYLVPYKFKPEASKHTGIYKGKTKTCPESIYFNYTDTLKKEVHPIKSEYRYKNKNKSKTSIHSGESEQKKTKPEKKTTVVSSEKSNKKKTSKFSQRRESVGLHGKRNSTILNKKQLPLPPTMETCLEDVDDEKIAVKNYIIGGVVVIKGNIEYIVNGVYTTYVKKEKKAEPETCRCVQLYDEYIEKTQRKKIQNVIGVKQTEDGIVYILGGVTSYMQKFEDRKRKNTYNITGVTMVNDSPVYIISAISSYITDDEDEELPDLNKKIVYNIGGVKNTPNGPMYIISGISTYTETITPSKKKLPDFIPFIITGEVANKIYKEFINKVRKSCKNNIYMVHNVKSSPFKFDSLCVETVITVPIDNKVYLNGVIISENDSSIAILSDKTTNIEMTDDSNVPCSYAIGFKDGSSTDYSIMGVPDFDPDVKINPKIMCDYIVGRIHTIPNNINVFIVDSFLTTDLMKINANSGSNAFIISDISESKDSTYYIITGVVNKEKYTQDDETRKKSTRNCGCYEIYEKYMSYQNSKPKDIMSSVCGETETNDTTPTVIIIGEAAKKLYDNFANKRIKAKHAFVLGNDLCNVAYRVSNIKLDSEVEKQNSNLYIISGVRTTSDGDIKAIISGVTKNKNVVSDKSDENEVEKQNSNLYIIGGIRETSDGDIKTIISGVTKNKNKKAVNNKCCIDKTNENLMIFGGIYTTPDGETNFIISGITRNKNPMKKTITCKCLDYYKKYKQQLKNKTISEPKKFTYFVGALPRNYNGNPSYVFTGEAADYIYNKYKKNKLAKQNLNFVIDTFTGKKEIINNIELSNTEELQSIYESKNKIIIGNLVSTEENKSTFVITSIKLNYGLDNTITRTLDESTVNAYKNCILLLYDFIMNVKCKDSYKKNSKSSSDENRSSSIFDEYDGPFPKYVKLIQIPPKKIPVNWKKQRQIIQEVLKEMAIDGYPIALLPQSYKLPHFRIWMRYRSKICLSSKDKEKLFKSSVNKWKHIQICKIKIPKPKLFKPNKKQSVTWKNVRYYRKKINKEKESIRTEVRQSLIEGSREFWPTTYHYDLPNPTFKDVFFAYCPWKEPIETMVVKPWMQHERKSS